MFHTEYTEVGKLLYRLKSRGDENTVPSLVSASVDCIRQRFAGFTIDALIGVPPSDTNRKVQPVKAIVGALAEALSKPDLSDRLKKVKDTPSLKNIFETEKRRELLKDAFTAEKLGLETVLLVDDLYRSGETATEIVNTLKTQADVKTVLLLTMTKTRTLR